MSDLSKDSQLEVGITVGGAYRVVRFVARGGMGSVYLVEHQSLKRALALKTLRPDKISRDAWVRFVTEAKVLARLEHPNLVKVYDLGTIDNKWPYFVMDYVDGQPLSEVIKKRGALPLAETLAIYEQVADGMVYAETLGLLHRDIKPSNLMLVESKSKYPQVKLMDFGLAIQAAGSGQGEKIFGSPPYMSPEQSLDQPLDHRSDIYSFGCALFETLTGAPPFIGESVLITLSKHQIEPPPTLREATLGEIFPPVLEKAVAKMLAKNPDQRFQNFTDVKELLKKMRSLEEEDRLRSDKIGDTKSYKESDRKSNHSKAGRNLERNSETVSQPLNMIAIVAGLACLVVAAGVLAYTFWPMIAPEPNKVAVDGGHPVTVFRGDSDIMSVPPPPYTAPDKADPVGVLSDFYEKIEPCKLVKINGKERRVFTFTPMYDMGSIGIAGDTGAKTGELVIAKGSLAFKPDLKVIFAPSMLCLSHPDFLTKIGPGNIYSLDMANNHALNDSSLACISGLTDLHALDLSLTDITDSALPIIAKLGALKCLAVARTEVTGDGLITLPQINQLQSLHLGRLFQTGRLLEKLKQSEALTNLIIEDESMTSKELKQVAQIKSLQSLTLSETNSKCSDLAELAPLAKLERLEFSNQSIDGDLVPAIKKLPALKTLVLLSLDLKDQQPGALKEALAPVKVEIVDKLNLPEKRR